jgi:hypothetical protein
MESDPAISPLGGGAEAKGIKQHNNDNHYVKIKERQLCSRKNNFHFLLPHNSGGEAITHKYNM